MSDEELELEFSFEEEENTLKEVNEEVNETKSPIREREPVSFSLADAQAMLGDDDYKLPFESDEPLKMAIEEEELPEATLNPSECDCCSPLVLDNVANVAVCELCHDVPYKMDWVVAPPLHTVYKKNLTSENGHPTVVVTKKEGTKHPFHNLLVIAKLINCKDNSDVSNEILVGAREEAKSYPEIGNSTKFEFKRLKIMMTSQQNKGHNFQLVLVLVAEQDDSRITLGTLYSSPMNVYSHKNLLPENKQIPGILRIVPNTVPSEGGQISIICNNIQDSKTMKVKVGNTIISKIPRRNAPVDSKGIKVYGGTLVVDIPAKNTLENSDKLYVTITNNGSDWSKKNQSDYIEYSSISCINMGVGSGPTVDSLLKVVEDAIKKEYMKESIARSNTPSMTTTTTTTDRTTTTTSPTSATALPPQKEISEIDSSLIDNLIQNDESKEERRLKRQERKQRKLERKRAREETNSTESRKKSHIEIE